MSADWTPIYSRWRHGGWYVDNIRYPSGAVGCVTNNPADKKWRIACDNRPDDHTYPTRDAAAYAEKAIADAQLATAASGECVQVFYDPPEVLEGTVFDPTDESFGPVMRDIQAGDFLAAASLLLDLEIKSGA